MEGGKTQLQVDEVFIEKEQGASEGLAVAGRICSLRVMDACPRASPEC